MVAWTLTKFRMKWGWLVAFARYSEYWRHARKLLDRGLRPWAIATYRPLQQINTRVLLSQLLEDPNELETYLAYLLAAVTLGVAYGYEVQGPNDKNIAVAKRLVHLASTTNPPGSVLVNSLPILRYIPEWLPWLSYKPLARYGYNLGQEVKHGLMSFVREGILNGTAQPSLALENLQETENLRGKERENAEEEVAGALGSMFGAATDTTLASLMSFFVAVLLHPNVQKRAQKELDAVTRRRRLPTFEDRPLLPFVDAVCKEVLRWRPPVPLAVPHATTKDDVYEGFFIPKGSQVVGNAWAILHDPVMYPEPDSFKPERFLNADGSLRDDPVLTSAFGFGRRVCPGRHFADATLFIVAASFLSVFNVGKASDTDNGPDAFSYAGTALCRPSTFRCFIVPRDKRAEGLIVADALTR